MPRHAVRLLCEARSQSRTTRDSATNEIPFYWRGGDVVFHLALTDNAQHLLAAGVGTITVQVKTLASTSADDPLLHKTFVAADCDSTFAAADWPGGSKQLLAAIFTEAEAAILPGTYRLIVTHEDGSGLEMVHASTELRVLDPQAGSEEIDAPPVPWSYLEGLPVLRTDTDQSLTNVQVQQALENLRLSAGGTGNNSGLRLLINSTGGLEWGVWNDDTNEYDVYRSSGAAGSQHLIRVPLP
jgi:hypothetical protein